MSVFDNLKLTKDRVKCLLESYPDLRDSDSRLVCNFIYREIGREKTELMSAVDLLNLMANNKITPSSSILRARRSLQAEYASLRGKSYKGRQEDALDVKGRIKQEY